MHVCFFVCVVGECLCVRAGMHVFGGKCCRVDEFIGTHASLSVGGAPCDCFVHTFAHIRVHVSACMQASLLRH